LLPLSYINQYAYCPRRFWYMHVEGEMIENAHVARGVASHERVHTEGYETLASGVVARRSVQVYSYSLGISGICDLVEEAADGTLTPIEYKQGKRGRWSNDQAQLCAQALCLEEMTGRAVPRGFLFYFGDRRREEVIFTPELRALTVDVIQAMQRALAIGAIPPHTTQRARCNGCSLYDVCLPKEMEIFCP
jgi:CRISPR-associated exonuclease Cas4